jgi:hypothetical protein
MMNWKTRRRPRTGRALGLIASCALAAAVQAAGAPPLSVSSNHRYLVDGSGRPFLLQGDAAWSLVANLSEEDAAAYLRDRKSKGFNAVLVNLIEHKFAAHAPSDLQGNAPFGSVNDFTTENEAYFAHADRVIRLAAENGITVLLAPIYLGYPGLDEGFYEETKANGPERCLAYGRYLGRRYAAFENILWVLGGDRDPGDVREDVDMVAYGIRQFDTRHLMTAHCHPESSPIEQYPGSWLDVSSSYAYEIVHQRLAWDYERKPVKPLFLIESVYEGEHNSSELQVRRQAYWAVLCGEFGHVMGNLPIWSFSQGWREAMQKPGSIAMERWGRLFRSRHWESLVPDNDHKVVTSGIGEFWGNDYLSAAASPDGSLLMAYMPDARPITIDMGRLSPGPSQAWWFNPRDGSAASAGIHPAAGEWTASPPGPGDWVLVVDRLSLGLRAPGSGT